MALPSLPYKPWFNIGDIVNYGHRAIVIITAIDEQGYTILFLNDHHQGKVLHCYANTYFEKLS